MSLVSTIKTRADYKNNLYNSKSTLYLTWYYLYIKYYLYQKFLENDL